MKKPTNFPLLLLLLCLSFYVVDRQPTTKEDRHSFFFFFSLSLSLFLPLTDERSKRSREDDKREAAAFRTKPSRIILKVRSSSEERSILFCPVVLSVVFALKDRRLSLFRRRVECDEMREKEVHTRAS